MTAPDNGGPAFPQASYNMKGGYDTTGGMTLRDYFAAKAMQGLMSDLAAIQEMPANIAKAAFVIADAMVEARK